MELLHDGEDSGIVLLDPGLVLPHSIPSSEAHLLTLWGDDGGVLEQLGLVFGGHELQVGEVPGVLVGRSLGNLLGIL